VILRTWYARLIGATDEAVHADRLVLPQTLDWIDARIATGVLGGAEPNAADFQIAPSVSRPMTVEELRPDHRDPARRSPSAGPRRDAPPASYR
jgi:glutathione S-transferase